MSRAARLVIPNVAHHVVHRAYNREPIFIGESDYAYYLSNLRALRSALGCKVYAFCIMLNHVHLLVNPGDNPANLSRLMKHLAGRQSGYVRKSERKAGPLWEGRYYSSPVAEDFLLACARFIVFNPVRHCLARRPEDYPWSSARSRLGIVPSVVDFHSAYLHLGQTPRERAKRYRGYLRAPIFWEEWETIRRAIFRSDVTGSDQFKRHIASQLGCSLSRRPRGRPRDQEIVTDGSGRHRHPRAADLSQSIFVDGA